MNLIKKLARDNWLYLFLIGIILLSFIIIKSTNNYESVLDLDNKVFDYFRKVAEPRKTTLMKFFTFYGNYYLPLLIIILTKLVFKDKSIWKILLYGYIFSCLVAFFSKILVNRPRPDMFLLQAPDAYSFPSGHTLTSTCFYLTFAFTMLYKNTLSNKLIYYSAFFVLTVCIGISRIYLGVHYLTDVIGGSLIGLLCTLIVINTTLKNNKEYIE